MDTDDINTDARIIITIVKAPLFENCDTKADIIAIKSIGTAAQMYETKLIGSLDTISLKLPPNRLAINEIMNVPNRNINAHMPIEIIFEIYILKREIGLTSDIIIELSENSPENKSVVSIIINSGRIIDDIKFRTVTGRVELFKRETPKVLPVTIFIIAAATVISIDNEKSIINFFFDIILFVSFIALINIVFILSSPLIIFNLGSIRKITGRFKNLI